MIPPPDEQRIARGFLPPEEHEAFQSVLLARILDTTKAAWQQIIARGQVLASDDENTISDRLAEQINAEVDRSPPDGYGFRTEWRIRRRSSPDATTRDVELDIVILYSWHGIRTIAVECKRVSNSVCDQRDVLGRDYVEKGVRRFVDGRYARGEALGLMYAFVLDGDCEGSATLIAAYLVKRETHPPHTCRPWRQETRFGSHANLFSTQHRQCGGPQLIELLHLFLPFPRR